jgi:hypothetical protein
MTCPQFLWINLCGKSFPQGKSLISIEEFLAMKFIAALTTVFSSSAEPASSQFLWTKLCASAHMHAEALDL